MASHTAPDLAQVSGYASSSSSSTGPSVMMASLAATASRAPAMFELAAAGFGKVPLNPNTLLIGAAATGLTYGAYKGFEWYQDRERVKESQAAAEREDFKQAYESSRSQQGQAWLQRHTHHLTAADTAVPGVYNPRTDKGKERVSSSTSHCETTDPVQGWVDPGFTTEPAKVKILWTPIPEPARPDLEGFNPAHLGIDTTPEGFDIYDGPQIQILTNKDASGSSSNVYKVRDFQKDDNIGLERFTKRLKNGALLDPKSKQSIVPDRARNSGARGHGGSYWKLFDAKGNRIGTISKDGRWLRG